MNKPLHFDKFDRYWELADAQTSTVPPEWVEILHAAFLAGAESVVDHYDGLLLRGASGEEFLEARQNVLDYVRHHIRKYQAPAAKPE